MEMIPVLLLYFVILGSIVFVGLLLWRKKPEGDWAYMAFVLLVALLTAMILIDTNRLSKFRLTMAGKDYRLSNVEVEEAFKANFGNILRVYNDYLVMESFDFSKPSSRWKIDTFEGKPAVFLRFKFEPLEKTISFVISNGGSVRLAGNSMKDGYYIVPYLDPAMTKDELLKDVSDGKVVWEVRYIKKP